MATPVGGPTTPPIRTRGVEWASEPDDAMPLATVHEIIDEIRAGRMVVLVDEEDRENEGDIVLAADFVTPEAINFMARHARGLICLTLTEERCRQLGLGPMTQANGTRFGTHFMVSIEAAEGVTTGISAADRARTIAAAVAPDARPEHIVQPGHVFPIMAQRGGVLVRAGHTEAGCDLAQMAGCSPAAVICEILNEDGSMARLPDLLEFAQQHGLKVGAIVDLIQHRSAHESLVIRGPERPIQTPWGEFELVSYRDKPSGQAHIALVHGKPCPERETLVRVHEPLSLLDLLDESGGSHSWPVGKALRALHGAPAGVMVMLNCGGDGAAVFTRLEQDAERLAGVPRRSAPKMDLRTYGIGAQILRDLGVRKMRLLSAPRKIPSMSGFELEVLGFEH